MSTPPSPLVVHLVHGTWQYGLLSKAGWEKRRRNKPERYPLKWFMAGSEFCQKLEEQAGRQLDVRTFEWSGKNSFVERRKATERLRESLKEALAHSPAGAQHVVVAHSHGGTVAFDALARRPAVPPTEKELAALEAKIAALEDSMPDAANRKKIAALLTMGTPFAALRELEGGFFQRVIRALISYRWLFLLLLCLVTVCFVAAAIHGAAYSPLAPLPLLVFPIVWLDLNRIWRCPHSGFSRFLWSLVRVLKILVAVALLLYAVLFFARFPWSAASFGTFVAFFVVGILVATLAAGKWLIRLPKGLAALLSFDAPELPCPLRAYRTPGDEAGLSIAAAQLADWLLTHLSIDVFLTLLWNGLKRWTEKLGPYLVVLGLWALVGLGHFASDIVSGQELRHPLAYAVLAVFESPALVLIVGGSLLISTFLMAHLGTLTLALATGGEVLRYAGFAAVEVEVLPSGVVAELEVLQIPSQQKQNLGLNHSLHELPTTRRRIGEFLKQVSKC